MVAATDLPQLGDGLFLTDGGLETTLIFHRGIDLPLFASFTLLGDEEGEHALRDYFAPYLAAAAECGAGFVLDTRRFPLVPGRSRYDIPHWGFWLSIGLMAVLAAALYVLFRRKEWL